MKKIMCFVVTAVLMFSLTACSGGFDDYDFTGTVGNTSENAVKASFCATDNFIYIIDSSLGFVEISKSTGDFVALSHINVSYAQFSVVDNYVFYAGEDGLTVTTLDDSFENVLTSGAVYSPIISYGEYIYYSEGRDGLLKRINIKTQKIENLSGDNIISEYGIYNDKLFYVMDTNLYTADLDGANAEILIENNAMYSLTYSDGKIYFINSGSSNYYVYSYDLSTQEMAEEVAMSTMYVTCLDDNLIILDRDGNLYIDGEELIDSNVQRFYVYEDELYYVNQSSELYEYNLEANTSNYISLEE